ncbi:S8 family serine peptidase [Kribbella sp. NBC_00359]|uniref:S8 family serine peptidase n=1 Tax=Kribbella sp. NBC_00359 TaxID=2975966 RepID=UPI002E219CBC
MLATLGSAAASSAPDHQVVVLGKSSGAAVPGKYFVKLKNNPSVSEHGVAARAGSLASGHSGKLARVIEGAVQGFSATMSAEQAQKLAAEPDVGYVQQERTYQAQSVQPNTPSWGVDRLDQRTGINASYNSIQSGGAGVHAYVIDSGIAYVTDSGRRRYDADIDGRVETGFNALDGSSNSNDCNGHGTFVAGTLGGIQYGVAKKVSLVPIKVFDCTGTVDSDDPIIAGINWVIAHAVKPAVINLSVGSICKNGGLPAPCPAGESQGIIDAEKAAIAAGISVVTSAGNENTDSCFNPVGSAGGTINVGATALNVDDTVSDSRWAVDAHTGSNWGGCVDIFAPGSNIVSIGGIGHSDPNDPGKVDPNPMTQSGTSVAAPHVAGAVALLLGTPKFATATPAQLAAELDAQSTRDIIDGLPSDGLTPNKLLFIRPTSPRTGTTVALVRQAGGSLRLFGTNADSSTNGTDLGGHMFTAAQVDAHKSLWDIFWTQSKDQGLSSVAAGSDGSGGALVGLTGLTAGDEVWHRQQKSENSPTWTKRSQLTGSLASVAEVSNADGRLMLIGADKHGGLHYYDQRIADDETSWDPVRTISFSGDAQNVTAVLDAGGRINVFIVDTHGVIWYMKQIDENLHNWTTPVQLADSDHRLMNEISVARDGNDKLELFGTAGDGHVWARVENVAGSNGDFGPWAEQLLPSKVLFHLSAAANIDNVMMVVGVDPEGGVWQSVQIPGTILFSSWTRIRALELRP